MMDPRLRPLNITPSYSGSTGSVWSNSDSVSYVFTDDPWAVGRWGYDGMAGAVTRKTDTRDSRRIRFAAHMLRGPFGALQSKKHSSHRHHHHHHRDSDTMSTTSSSSSYSSSSRRSRQFSRAPSPMPAPPPHGYAGPPPPPPGPHFQHPQHFDNFPHGQPMGGMMSPRPPMPMPMPGPPLQPGFQDGFIQLNGPGGSPAPQDPWANGAQYGGHAEVYD
ncbi:hypothetical protein F4777DRAFT_155252 [Nemania sp. FL0916]|nr:hypothetical protein F4777DRAFT_155252 [Nemania sp. FL0916]